MTILNENSYFDLDRKQGYFCWQPFLRDSNDRDLGGHVGTIKLIRILLFMTVQHGGDEVSRKRSIRRTLNKFNKSIGFMRKI